MRRDQQTGVLTMSEELEPDNIDDILNILNILQRRLWEMMRRYREVHFYNRPLGIPASEAQATLLPLVYKLLFSLKARQANLSDDNFSGGYITLIEAYGDVERLIIRLFPGSGFERPDTIGDYGLAPEAELGLLTDAARLLVNDLRRVFGYSDD
jgi:hypothetical protein